MDMKMQIGAMVVALVGAIRIRFPKLDGLLVLLVTMLLAIGLDALYVPAAPLDVVRTGIGIGLAAAGIMHLVSYGAGKFGDAMGQGMATIPPPAPVTTNIVQLAPETTADAVTKALQSVQDEPTPPTPPKPPPGPKSAA